MVLCLWWHYWCSCFLLPFVFIAGPQALFIVLQDLLAWDLCVCLLFPPPDLEHTHAMFLFSWFSCNALGIRIYNSHIALRNCEGWQITQIVNFTIILLKVVCADVSEFSVFSSVVSAYFYKMYHYTDSENVSNKTSSDQT